MTTLHNEILIDAPLEKVWDALAELEKLEMIDPQVKKSSALSPQASGLGAERKVDMMDNKNWFREKCTVFKENEALTYELQACSFPVHGLNHSYSFEQVDEQIRVVQKMRYQMKYGILGNVMGLMIKPMWNKGNRGFLAGLKTYVETNQA